MTSGDIASFPSALPDREGAPFPLSESQDQEDLEPVKKRIKAGQSPVILYPWYPNNSVPLQKPKALS